MNCQVMDRPCILRTIHRGGNCLGVAGLAFRRAAVEFLFVSVWMFSLLALIKASNIELFNLFVVR